LRVTLDVTLDPGRRTGAHEAARRPGVARAVAVDEGFSATRGRVYQRATLRAVHRDLDRLVRVLAEPITEVRRDALIGHVRYLVVQVDQLIRPVAVRVPTALGPEEPAGCTQVVAALTALQVQARRWAREPSARPAVLAAARDARAALWGDDDAAAPGALAGTPPAGRGAAGRAGWNRVPTRLAYRVFWLLDELEPALADPLVAELSAPVMWVLRNLFSGGYNRRAYLMWVGGGSGPAV